MAPFMHHDLVVAETTLQSSMQSQLFTMSPVSPRFRKLQTRPLSSTYLVESPYITEILALATTKILTTDEKGSDGNLYNRFAADSAASPLKYLMVTTHSAALGKPVKNTLAILVY